MGLPYLMDYTPGGNNTMDRVFLLSIDEVLQHFGDSGYVAKGANMGPFERAFVNPSGSNVTLQSQIHDQYNEARMTTGPGIYSWWLRSPGGKPSFAAVVNHGALTIMGNAVDRNFSVRPALWLYL